MCMTYHCFYSVAAVLLLNSSVSVYLTATMLIIPGQLHFYIILGMLRIQDEICTYHTKQVMSNINLHVYYIYIHKIKSQSNIQCTYLAYDLKHELEI